MSSHSTAPTPSSPHAGYRPHSKPSRAGWWWLAAAGAVLVAGAVAVVALNATVFSAAQPVKQYLKALANGDGATAMELSQAYLTDEDGEPVDSGDNPRGVSTALLDGQPLIDTQAGLGEPTIEVDSDAEIPAEFRRDDLHQTVVRLSYDQQQDPTLFVVDRHGRDWLVFDRWQMHPLPLHEVHVASDGFPAGSRIDHPTGTINSAEVPLLGEASEQHLSTPVATFVPAQLTVDYHGTYVAADQSVTHTLTDNTPPSADQTQTLELDLELTEQVTEKVQEEVSQELTHCTDQQVLQPSGCPFGYSTVNRVDPDSIEWSLLESPEVMYTDEPGSPGIERIEAIAQLEVDETDVGTGEQSRTEYQQPFMLEANLRLTPEHIEVTLHWQ
ncbi:hypothetical protein [Auritidibacter ignavus]|uniref:hypothetical protein n=1 Tax=Auritidibacter ignavus TaxID=678932 RepID=UPI0024BAACDC|nr:hypothetical protein [Auritidibacter ignavus]WHS35585.1 hypothetical protein QM403_03240 [Auritidibacter ignavus]